MNRQIVRAAVGGDTTSAYRAWVPDIVLSLGGLDVEEIAIFKFRATCLAVLENVRKTGRAVLVARFGESVAQVVPHHSSNRPKHWIGSLAGTGQITGDIVSPASDDL